MAYIHVYDNGGGIRNVPVLTNAGNIVGTAGNGVSYGGSLTEELANLGANAYGWIKPVHMPVLDPQMHIGMTPITSGVMTISHDAAVGEFISSSIKVDMSGSGTSVSARLPLSNSVEAGPASQPIKLGPAIHVRIKCSDWSLVSRLYINFTQDGGTTNYYLAQVINSSRSFYGLLDPAYSSAWSGFRTLIFHPSDLTKVGNPAAYGNTARYFATDGIAFSVSCTAAVSFHINRIYSPDWPVGVFCPIMDGCYSSARQILASDFLARGWGLGGSADNVGIGGIYPAYSDLVALSNAGVDIFCHGHALSGTLTTPLSTSVTPATVRSVLSSQRRALLSSGVKSKSPAWHQWLTNVGQYTGTDMAGILKENGIGAGRGDTSDAEFGINPAASSYTTTGSNIFVGSYANKRGRFNRAYIASYAGISPSHNDEHGYDVAGTLKKSLETTAALGHVLHSYVHQILEVPGQYDIGLNFYRDFLADLTSYVNSGQIIVMSPSQLERITYLAEGAIYLRWDNEWVYRSDPTTIAF